MTTSQLESDAAVQLPSSAQVVGGRVWSIDELSRQVEKTCAARGIGLQALDVDLPAPLAGFTKLYATRLPDPFDPDGDDVEHVVVAAAGEWSQARTDAFIAAMAGWVPAKGPLRRATRSPIGPPCRKSPLSKRMLACGPVRRASISDAVRASPIRSDGRSAR